MNEMNGSWLKQYPYCLLTEYFITENGITESTPYEIREISARELITPERIDLMAKWIYIDMVEKGMNYEDGLELYKKHIEAFSQGTFTEPGTEEKNTFAKYLEEFNKIIVSIKDNGFIMEKSLIPIGKDNVLLDGSHRCASAAYYDKKVRTIFFGNLYRDYGAAFFNARLLDEECLDWMVLQYCNLENHLFFACFWPVSEKEMRKKAIDEIAASCGKVVYQKEIRLSYVALRNLMIQAYGKQKWIGTVDNYHAGVDEKAKACYANKPMTIVIFHCDNLEKVILTKQRIRDKYGIGNHSIHITDSDEEAKLLANILLNKNSLHLIKKGDLDYSDEVNVMVQEVLKEDDLLGRDIIAEPEGTMAIYGLARPESKLRMLTYDELKNCTVLRKMGMTPYDLLYNPQNYLVFNGVKFMNLKRAKQWIGNAKPRIRGINLKRVGYRLRYFLCHASITQIEHSCLYKYKKKQYIARICLFRKIKETTIYILNKIHLLEIALKVFHRIKR